MTSEASSTQMDPSDPLFSGGSEMGARMRAIDWSRTPLGPVETWPQSLSTCCPHHPHVAPADVRVVGRSTHQPLQRRLQVHRRRQAPRALGQPASVVWREIWDEVGPRAESAMRRERRHVRRSAAARSWSATATREETYYTFSYSPVPNDQGGTGGIICANTDDTQRIIGERQLALLRELAAKTARRTHARGRCALERQCLATNPHDLPFSLIYLRRSGWTTCHASWGCRASRPSTVASRLESVRLQLDTVWPFARKSLKSHRSAIVSDLGSSILSIFRTGVWPKARHIRQWFCRLRPPARPAGHTVLIVGLNPYRLFDENYRGFLELAARQIAASIGNAAGVQNERQRAEVPGRTRPRQDRLLFSNVSHEFRTPLTLMLGPLEDALGQPGGLPICGNSWSWRIECGLRLLKLVNTLLDFSRIEAGRIRSSLSAYGSRRLHDRSRQCLSLGG